MPAVSGMGAGFDTDIVPGSGLTGPLTFRQASIKFGIYQAHLIMLPCLIKGNIYRNLLFQYKKGRSGFRSFQLGPASETPSARIGKGAVASAAC